MSEPHPAPVFIHLGFHKTGSSYLQAMALRNSFLADHLIILNQRNQTSKNLRIACHEVLKPDVKRHMRGLADVIQTARSISEQNLLDPRPIFITDEEITGVIPGRDKTWSVYPRLRDVMASLEEGFAPRTVRYFAYTRSEDAWLRSAYQESVKRHMMTLELDEYISNVKFEGGFAALLQRIKEDRPPDQLTAVDMSIDAQTEFGLGLSLFRWLGLPEESISSMIKPERINESIGPEMQKLFLELNGAGLNGKDLMTVKRIILRQHGYKW